MIKRALLIILGATAVANVLQAAPLTPAEALQRARALNGSRHGVAALHNEAATPAFTSYAADLPASYIFARPEGWVILSADDMAPAVLGYSDNGTFDPDNIPDNMRAWLQSYAEQIQWMRANPTKFAPVATTAEAETRTDIAPMLTTKWNQDSPFNDMTPIINGQHSVTGCVATAMAQVMNYHKWPAVGKGTHSYEMDDQTMTINFAEHPFDWDNMANVYNATTPEAQKKAVADLMYTCGLSINSYYDPQATGALTSDLAKALMNYFDYNEGIGWAQRQYYKADEWDALIYEQLKNVGPVVYGGTTSGGAGHQFVCDGYRSDGYFHINWGWGGLSDGYYLLSVMAPAMQGIGGSYAGYNFSQDAIINISPRKAELPGEPWVCMGMVNSFSVNQTVPKIGNFFSTASRSTWFVNWGFEDITCDIAFIVEGKTKEGSDTIFTFGGSRGSEVYRKDYLMKTYTAENRYPYFSSTISGYMPTMSDGEYTVYPGYRVSKIGDKTIDEADRVWSKFSFCPSVTSFYTMVVDNGAITLFKPQELGVPTVSEYSFDTPLYMGRTAVVKAKITNNTETEFYGDIVGFFFKNTATPDNPGSPAYSNAGASRMSIRPGETIDYEYTFKFAPNVNYTDDYKFAFVARPYTIESNSSTYWIISEMKPISSQIAPYGTVTATSAVATDGNILCMPKDMLDFAIDVTCDEGTYYNTIDFWVYEFEPDNSGTPEVDPGDVTDEPSAAPAIVRTEAGKWYRKFVTYSPYLQLQSGQNKTVTVHLNFDGEIGKIYGLKAFTTWTAISDMIEFTLADNSSAFDYEVMSIDAAPVAADANEDGSIPVDMLNFTNNVTVTRGTFAAPIDFMIYKKVADNWELYSTASSATLNLTQGEAANASVTLDLPVGDTVYGIRAYAGPYKLNEMREFTVAEESQMSGIDTAVTDNVDTVRYYNLQGVEVANPRHGEIVIRISGGKAEKMIVR